MYEDGDKKPAVALILTKSDLLSNFIMENVFSGAMSVQDALDQAQA